MDPPKFNLPVNFEYKITTCIEKGDCCYVNNVLSYKRMPTDLEFSNMTLDQQWGIIESLKKENEYLEIAIKNMKLRIEANNICGVQNIT